MTVIFQHQITAYWKIANIFLINSFVFLLFTLTSIEFSPLAPFTINYVYSITFYCLATAHFLPSTLVSIFSKHQNSFRISSMRSKKLSSVTLILLHFPLCSFFLLIYLYFDIICFFFRLRTAATLNLRSNYRCCSCLCCCNCRNKNYFYTHRSLHTLLA